MPGGLDANGIRAKKFPGGPNTCIVNKITGKKTYINRKRNNKDIIIHDDSKPLEEMTLSELLIEYIKAFNRDPSAALKIMNIKCKHEWIKDPENNRVRQCIKCKVIQDLHIYPLSRKWKDRKGQPKCRKSIRKL